MKKLAILAATTVALSSTALASTQDTFYVKLNAGAIMLNKVKDKATGLKLKSKANAFVNGGVGYNVMDNARVDLTLEGLISPQAKKSGSATSVAGASLPSATSGSVKHKANVYALIVSGYVDLFDVSVAKVYAGAGVGFAQVKEKISVSGFGKDISVSSKKANNFAYQLTLGVASEVADGVNAELFYKWADYGKTKSGVSDGFELSKTSYRGHNIGVGVRFDI